MDKVFCIGELLIDFICKDKGKNLIEGSNFEKKAGGAPANVAVTISKLEGASYFLGQVGKDSFGRYLIKILKDLDVDTSMTVMEGNTTLSFVAIDEEGERDFEFIRGSDSQYDFKNIDLSKISSEDIVHFGSATGFLEGKLKETYFKLFQYAIDNKMFISFDPNYRDNLIDDSYLEEYIRCCKEFISHSDWIKLSLEEMKLITGEKDIALAVNILHSYGCKVITVTLGEKGAILSYQGKKEIIPSIKVKQIDSTGAGDAFVGGVLREIACEKNKDSISFDVWKEIIRYANIVGAITCTQYGAIDAVPTIEDIKNLKVDV